MRGDLSYLGRPQAEFFVQHAEEIFDGETASSFQGHDGVPSTGGPVIEFDGCSVASVAAD